MHNISDTVPSVNFDVCSFCNMKCKYCFGAFGDIDKTVLQKGALDKDSATKIIQLLADYGFKKITFAGGEPLLCEWIDDAIVSAKNKGMTTCLVTNGSKINEKWLSKVSDYLDWIALSIDSVDRRKLERIGRVAKGKAITEEKYIFLSELINKFGIRLKINTVVTAANHQETLSNTINKIKPERWKILQVLPIKGQNDSGIGGLTINCNDFDKYVSRNLSKLNDQTTLVFESNELMTASYVMVDPAGRFFDNATGRHNYSDPILDIGVAQALTQVNINSDMFQKRGGVYDWNKYLGIDETSCSKNDALEYLSNKINKLSLDEHGSKALYQIAIDPNGIDKDAASHLLASLVNISNEEATTVLLQLLGKGYLVLFDGENDPRIFANYKALDIPIKIKDIITYDLQPFENHGQPHSKQSMQSLDQFFLENDKAIYIALEMTSAHLFKQLEKRSGLGKKTIFLMPKRAHVEDSNKDRYNEVIENWVKRIKKGPRHLFENTRILLTDMPHPELYTSAVGESAARFDVYFYDAKSTLYGSILQVKKGTSLYGIIESRYASAVANSAPLWKIWRKDATVFWLKQQLFPISLIAMGATLAAIPNAVGVALSSIVLGILVNLVSGNHIYRTSRFAKLFRR